MLKHLTWLVWVLSSDIYFCVVICDIRPQSFPSLQVVQMRTGSHDLARLDNAAIDKARPDCEGHVSTSNETYLFIQLCHVACCDINWITTATVRKSAGTKKMSMRNVYFFKKAANVTVASTTLIRG